MAITKMLASMIQFLSEAFMRIFSPTDDAYPVIGFQPFTGIPYKRGKAASW
ncbi:nicotinate phosphoribosyltransferase [Sphaerospermopsis aphanizomenoides BCCUSP55]|uniref:nicotinate phosphoribosyltransferase n=1 Tax=Sphaerospermopsis aphanizomenoides TaxID=459663 RepID=UPI000B0E2418|nr:nicotinate phosphoribosyltransferase [Sphaerospermopsis aphanizomenoides]MBK1987049.1 nicotinate phosphoribosyltransferase [Sphaerospermopsis aphanizomenoides BCCUSP55]